jgi:hypothetical protein
MVSKKNLAVIFPEYLYSYMKGKKKNTKELLHEGDLSGGTVRDALTAPFPIT